MRRATCSAILFSAIFGMVEAAVAADPRSIDWSTIPTKSLSLFYPGQSTYGWLISGDHVGAQQVRQGQACRLCHEGSERDRGNRIVKGGSLEPAPTGGEPTPQD